MLASLNTSASASRLSCTCQAPAALNSCYSIADSAASLSFYKLPHPDLQALSWGRPLFGPDWLGNAGYHVH